MDEELCELIQTFTSHDDGTWTELWLDSDGKEIRRIEHGNRPFDVLEYSSEPTDSEILREFDERDN